MPNEERPGQSQPSTSLLTQGPESLKQAFLLHWSTNDTVAALDVQLSPAALDAVYKWLNQHKDVTILPLLVSCWYLFQWA